MKTDTEVQYHVTLKHPMSIKISDATELIRAFDAVLDADVSPVMPSAFEFKTDMLYRAYSAEGTKEFAMKTTLHIPADNIAGVIAQPFKER